MQQACFSDEPWSAEFIGSLLAQPGTFALLAVRGGDDPVGTDPMGPDPLGFVLARVVAEDAEILTIGVLPGARGGGFGRRLVDEATDGARRLGATALFLEVAEDNAAARALYAAAGFAPVGRRPGYYKRPDGRVAALVLRRSF
ncbi:GNAT family N-acetyltransferase [Azospirillum sp.]|uniref:GNAT family N-acetyltransferase n=1 Tax=Azospirillum sp. TaxID=34012 RepID=UPI002D279A8C|nr:GNAT family N-acetyltransferase [Azospirillum sp.]HYD63907.1 GNAT family N-acetyltransferase [Azospirillum sp.]